MKRKGKEAAKRYKTFYGTINPSSSLQTILEGYSALVSKNLFSILLMRISVHMDVYVTNFEYAKINN